MRVRVGARACVGVWVCVQHSTIKRHLSEGVLSKQAAKAWDGFKGPFAPFTVSLTHNIRVCGCGVVGHTLAAAVMNV